MTSLKNLEHKYTISLESSIICYGGATEGEGETEQNQICNSSKLNEKILEEGQYFDDTFFCDIIILTSFAKQKVSHGRLVLQGPRPRPRHFSAKQIVLKLQ